MMAVIIRIISTALMIIMRDFFWNFEAIWPDRPEKKKNGQMNNAAMALSRMPILVFDLLAITKVKRIMKEFLKILSFKAPKNWTVKRARKFLDFRI